MKATKVTIVFIFLSLLLVNCSSSKKAMAMPVATSGSDSVPEQTTKDGSSFEKAIVVKNINEEYSYVKKVCPECKLVRQALKVNNKKYYDALYFDKSGKAVVYYFDINSFYGKLF